MKEWSGAEVAGSSDGRREGLGSSAPSAGASVVIVVVQRVDNATSVQNAKVPVKTHQSAGRGCVNFTTFSGGTVQFPSSVDGLSIAYPS